MCIRDRQETVTVRFGHVLFGSYQAQPGGDCQFCLKHAAHHAGDAVSFGDGVDLACKKNITEADCDSFLFYEDEQTGMNGGFTRVNDRFTLLDQPGFGLDISF